MSRIEPKAPPAVGRGHEGVARTRILAAATELISRNGIRGVSADRVIEQAGITKVTFYRHFRTKSDLVVAYLQQQAGREQEAFVAASADADPVEALENIADLIGMASCLPGFRGCAFINAAAETPDPADPVRVVVDEHRQWMLGLFAGIATRAGVDDPAVTARQLMMLRDGAMINGYLGHPEEIGDTLRGAYSATLERGRARA
jgi:AcrR family transcriptional regulator